MAVVYLISGTGICSGNYKYWSSKKECDDWFLKKAIVEVEALSFIRPDQITKNAYNTACVHVPRDYYQTLKCDYISFYNDIEGRYFHAQIIGREYVNEQSSRLYYVIDYVASFWDLITINNSFIERTHVSDDWDGNFTASKYLLGEPLAMDVFYRPEVEGTNPLDFINIELTPNNSDYTLITTVKPDGTFNDPQINYQAGGSIAGYITVGSKAKIEETLKKYVTYSNQLINRKDSILSYLNNIFISPNVVANNTDNKPIEDNANAYFSDMFDLGAMYKPRHAKVYDCLRVRFYTTVNSAVFRPSECITGIVFSIYKSGSPTGCYTVSFQGGQGGAYLARIQTPTWAPVSVSAVTKANEFEFNKEWESKASQLESNGQTPAQFNPNAKW